MDLSNSKFFNWIKGTRLGSWASTQASNQVTNLQHQRGLYSPEDERKLETWKNAYNLTDDDVALIRPLLANGVSREEILNYINNLTAQHQTDIKNSLSSKIAEERSVGLNPDLAGVPEGSDSASVPFEGSSDPLKSGSKASLSSRFDQVSGLLFKTISLGLQAYGLVGNQLISESKSILELAGSDVLGLSADDKGMITDVDSALNDLVTARGLRGRKARKYADAVRATINSVPVAVERLKSGSEYNRAMADFKVSEAENSEDVVSNTLQFITDSAATKASVAKYDLEIAKAKEQFLIDHPNYTSEQMELELSNSKADNRKKTADADLAELQTEEQRLQNGKLEIDNSIAQSDADRKKSDNDIQILRNTINSLELDGFEEMISFCKRWEKMKSMHKGYFDMGLSPNQYHENESRYKEYKKLIKQWRGKQKDPQFKVDTPVGSVTF